MKQNPYGFSMVEMLVVIAVLGIALAFALPLLGDNGRRLVREAQTRFSSDIERVRTLVPRFNASYLLTISANNNTYSLVPQDASGNVITGIPTINGVMPNGATLFAMTGADLTTPLYRAPFGRFGGGAAESCFEIRGPNNFRAAVSLNGVTGKVITRAVQAQAATTCI